MSYSHFTKICGILGSFVGAAGHEIQTADADGHLFHGGTEITPTAATINGADAILQKAPSWFTVTALDGSAGKKACVTNGVSAIAGGTGIADMTLAAPSAGDLATIRIASITSGTVVVTCAEGVTVDGTNEIMTFDAAGDTIVLAYKSATQWQIVMNLGAVALSTAG
jgi:hypothetical protein